VQRLKSEDLENQQIQGALDEVRRFAHAHSSRLPSDNSALPLGKQEEYYPLPKNLR
jgi:hypothetical protein